MPLAFNSISHGEVAFGFFNIDSDMLLLEQYFIFADDFCKYISEFAEHESNDPYEASWNIYYIADRKDIGDLMGAIHGVRFTGFIGETYRKFPFPEKQEDFKQQPDGHKSQEIIKSMISKYSGMKQISFTHNKGQTIKIGAYDFEINSFLELVKYVWRGGYPRWKGEERPDYVLEMKNIVSKNINKSFAAISFDE